MKDFHRPPAELDSLDVDDLEALDRILAKLSVERRAKKGNRHEVHA